MIISNTIKPLILPLLAMIIIVVASNILVHSGVPYFGLENKLTWGALIYPISFLVTDLTNRRYGAPLSRKLIIFGFVIAIGVSYFLATPRIAFASGTAFLIGQLLDVTVFNRLRAGTWWHAPLAGSLIGSAVDNTLFFTLAFYGVEKMSKIVPLGMGTDLTLPLWQNIAVWDFGVKVAVSLLALIPYGALLNVLRPLKTSSI
jgi:queuosine precursor transporter